MRIGLNTLFMVPGKMGGTETYARGLIGGLTRVDRENEYVILANRENAPTWGPLPDNFSVFECPVAGSNKVARTLYEQVRLSRDVRSLGIGLLHSLGYVAPPRKAGIRSVVTIGDIIFRRFPKEFGTVQRLVAGILTRRAALSAERIITFSEFSKQDIASEYGVPPGRINVTLLAGRGFAKDDDDAQALFQKFHIPAHYIYTVSASYYHKNLDGLLRAFHLLRRQHDIPHKLVVSGLRMAAHGHVVRLMEELSLGESVIFTEWIPDAAMGTLYRRAECFVFPSLYEGFGLPVLEAMALGTPVVCSNATSLPEVAGDGALLFDPQNVEEMADAIQRCLSDVELRQALIARGKAQAARFSWERCARETLEAYRAASLRATA